tara:strand:+ start:14589 stop:14870 length:282 start_codon:yes stop_codon:yes gene_type:complete
MGLESQLEGKLAKYAKSKGCLTYKFSSPANRGVPDRIFIGPTGKVLFMEIKAPGKEPTALQMMHINQIREHKGLATWTSDFENGKAQISFHIL